MKSGGVRLKLKCTSVVALCDGPDIHVFFNGVPAQGGITWSSLVELLYSRERAREWFAKSITMIV